MNTAHAVFMIKPSTHVDGIRTLINDDVHRLTQMQKLIIIQRRYTEFQHMTILRKIPVL